MKIRIKKYLYSQAPKNKVKSCKPYFFICLIISSDSNPVGQIELVLDKNSFFPARRDLGLTKNNKIRSDQKFGLILDFGRIYLFLVRPEFGEADFWPARTRFCRDPEVVMTSRILVETKFMFLRSGRNLIR